MTPDQVVGLVSTLSNVRSRPDTGQVCSAVRDLLASHTDTAGRSEVQVRYITETFRISRP